MVSLAIFWAAVIAIILFCFSIIFKALASLIEGMLMTIGIGIAGGFLGGAAILILLLLHMIAESLVEGNFWGMIGSIIFGVFIIGLVIGVVFQLGAVIIGFAYCIATWIIEITLSATNKIGNLCENGYIHFLSVIQKRIERC